MTFGSRRDYGFQPRDAAETARRTEQQPLDTYVSGPAAATADEQVLRHTLRERYLTPQVTTPQEYRERLQLQLNRRSVPSMRTIPVVLNPGESQNAYEAQFQNWLPGPRPHRHEVSTPPAPAASTVARSLEPAAPATGQSLSSAADLSSSHSSGKRSAPGDAVARHGGVPAPDVPDHKRSRHQGNLAGGEPQTPKSYVSEDNPSTSQDVGAGGGGESPLDPLVASTSDPRALKQRVGSLNQYVHDSNGSVGRLADDLEEMHRRVDWFDTPQAVQNRVADLERQVAQLQGQLEILLRLQQLGYRPLALPLAVSQPAVALPPAVSQRPVVAQPPADAQPPSGSAPATLRSPEQDQDTDRASP
ncbi:hypothetical protein L914_02326, partial [Phytophthora nicotianae]